MRPGTLEVKGFECLKNGKNKAPSFMQSLNKDDSFGLLLFRCIDFNPIPVGLLFQIYPGMV